MSSIKVKTITKYVVDGEEFDTEQEARDFLELNEMEDRLEGAFMSFECSIANETYNSMRGRLPKIIELFKLAGYEIKDVRGGSEC